MSAINQLIAIAIYIQAATAWLFIIEYQRRTRGAWRRSVVGWHVMALTFVDALFSTGLAIAHIWPALALQMVFLWSIALVFLAGALITAWRLWILLLVQPDRDSPGLPSPPSTSNSPSVDAHPRRSPSTPAAE